MTRRELDFLSAEIEKQNFRERAENEICFIIIMIAVAFMIFSGVIV